MIKGDLGFSLDDRATNQIIDGIKRMEYISFLVVMQKLVLISISNDRYSNKL